MDLPRDMTDGSVRNDASSFSGSRSGESLDSRLRKGDLYVRAGDHAQALETFLSLWPFCAGRDLLYLAWRIADCQGRLGRLGEAIALLRPVTEAHDPALLEDEERFQYGKCLQQLGISYFRAGRLDDAQSVGLRALECFPGERSNELGNAHSLLGAVALHSGDVDLAGTHFRRSLEQYRALGNVTDMAAAYSNLGSVYKRTCEWERALEHYNASYYLQATEGEFQEQGAVHQNLGIVLTNVGRLDVADDHLNRSYRRAVELGQPLRALRARLARIRLSRMRLEIDQARVQIRECARDHPDSVPERESCLLALETAWLDLLTDRVSAVQESLEPLEARVARMAARGDLMLETRRLRAAVAFELGRWEEAERLLLEAFDLARADHDRHQETHLVAALARTRGAMGRIEEAHSGFEAAARRFERTGERPAFAQVLEWQGDLAREIERDPATAAKHYRRARDAARRMGNVRLEILLDLELATARLESGEIADAHPALRAARDRMESLPRSDASFHALAMKLIKPLEARGVPGRTEATDGSSILRHLEEIGEWEAEPAEKLRAAVGLLADGVGAEGALLARIVESGLEVVTTLSMGWLDGRRQFEPEVLGYPVPERGQLVERVHDVSAMPYKSAMTVPFMLGTQRHVLHLERRDAPDGFGTADLNYSGLFLAELARSSARFLPAASEDDASPMARLRHGIYVADIITQDPRMLSILSLVKKIATSELTVLLQGETGTGKRLVAHAIHRISERRDRPFITVDCAALPDTLLESELFGHRKGAFTGATQDRTGLFVEADGGTVFLDEIDKTGPSVQRRFLTLLDTGEVRPVGATGYRRLDVRVVCATSCPELAHEVEEGRFIKDLFYRLNDISIEIPPLRERPEDVGLLAECFLEKFCGEAGREIRGVSPDFFEALARHDWPGNVRELEKAIRRAVALSEDGDVLSARSLPDAVQSLDGGSRRAGSLKDRIEDFEKEILLESLDRNRWNKSRAAGELGLSRKGLKGKVERYGLDRRHRRR